MYRFGLVATSGTMALFFVPKTVYAQSDGSKIKISDLPIYDIEEKKQTFRVEKEKVSTIREYISEARKWSWPYFETINEYSSKAKHIYETGKAHSQSTVEMVRDESAGFTRASIITVSGLGGIILGFRGGMIKKLFYGTLAATSAAAFCYPEQASELASDVWEFMKTSSNEILYPTEKNEAADKDKK